ncbi:SNF2 family N-terminal domain-containing protein [Myxozyma melibiosi]|uniref:SNF2 family N-terminal domain-containing protein n=1 Tax=Myxozyma melibiosi TaxID=54550 RepID=A0ABR1FBI6_9ASCO
MSNEEAAVQALSIMQSGVTAVVNDDESSSELTDLDRPDAVNASDQDEEMIDSDGSDGNNRSASDADQSDFEEADEADGDEDDEDEDDNDVDSQETEEEDLRGISKETDSKERSSKNGTASDGEDGVNEAEGGSSDTMSHSKNSKSARRKPEYFDPELYGLRRSNRSHVAPDRFVEFDAADESDETPRKSRKAMKRETKTAASSRTQSASSDSDDFGASSRSRKKRRKTSNHVSEMRFSTRNNKVMNYNEDDFDNDLDLSEEEVYPVKSSEKTSYQEEYYVGDTRAIDLVLDHRPIAEGPDNGTNDPRKDLEYYIKWQGISHLHNTWETYEDLSVLKGNKRLDNYIRQNVILDSQIRSDPSTSREDIEAMDLERERLRENYEEFKTVERVVSSERSNADGKKKLRYLVKWKRLYYDACTWEDAEYVAKIAPRAVEQFLARSNSKLLPSNSVNYGARRPRFEKLTEQPSYVKNGELRDFQLTGLNWMAFLWSRNENGILADEMGLGKTVQTIAFLSWLVYARKQHGPFLVVVPLSTVPAWQETIDLWAPDLNYIVYLGNTESRRVMRTHEFYVDGNKKKPKFNILLTTYEYILKDRSELGSIKWRFLAVDEAHRLKNSESALYESLQEFKVENRLLITGTPLQNNIRELAALIDFLMPGKINIDLEIDFESPGANQEVYIRDLHEQLKPFILRRLKKDVEKSLPSKSERILRVELSDMQTEYYKNIISRNYSALNAGATGSSQLSLLNIMMELKKASNHPYLFPNAENQFLSSLDGDHSNERIFRGMIMNSGKMVLLDKLLGRLRRDGHRVLIFSQMVRMLDILGDYLTQRGLPFQRLDGTIPAQTRRIAIDHFNAPGSPDFVFLLSTRAGGLGINLMTADTVIIFDSDWNPQADLQAMARAHRIGQKSHVMVYRFVSKDTVEEEVLERARRKMILEYAIISLGITDKSGASKKTEPTSKELSAILKFGAGNMFKANENQKKLENMNLDDVLEHAEDHETQPDLGESHLGGEEFLKQFEVTDYKADVDWDDIIPAGDLAKIKEEDRKRQEEEYLQEQINLSSRRKVTMRQLSNDNDSEDSSSQRENRRKERAIKRKHETDGAGDPNSLTERDIRGIYKSILRYGNLRERWHQIVADGSFSNKEPERIKEVFDEMTELSKEAIARQEARRVEMEKNLPPSEVGKKKERKAVLFEYKGLVKNLNAELILQRPQDLKILDDAIPKEDPLTFKLKGHVKSVHGWNCSWELKDDEMLLVGVFKYGYGAWASIRDDPTLGLSDKFFLEEHRIEKKEERVKEEKSGPKMPGPVHLGRRVEYLISLLKEPEPRDAEKDSRRRKRLATKTGKVNSGSASASPAPPAGIKGENAKATESSHDHSAPANGSSAPPRAKTAKAERPKKVSGSLPPLSAHRREKVEKVEKVERNGDESDYPSMDEQSCKDMLHPVRQSLRRLRKGGAGIDRAEWADILKRELTSVGDHIHRKVSSAPRDEQDKLYKHLWVFASYFWPAKVSSRKIAEMYSKLRKQRQAAASEQKNGTAVKQENRP